MHQPGAVFVFFSNRLGCAGSLVVTGVLTLLLIVVTRSCNSVTTF